MVPITHSDGLKNTVQTVENVCNITVKKSLTFQCQTSDGKNETCRCMRIVK